MIKVHDCYLPLYTDKKHPIILITGGRGCEDPETPIMMSDLTVRKLKEIKVGDYVMGDDGTPRKVLETLRGMSMMYKVHQANAEDYIVNDTHILSLKKRPSCLVPYGPITRSGALRHPNGRYPEYPEYADIPIKEYLGKSARFKENFSGYKSGSIPYPESEVRLEPYILGLWLGDGTSIFPNITNPDEEIRDYLLDYCNRHDQNICWEYKKGAYHIHINGDGKVGHNDFLNGLKELDLIGNKHIPQEYISNSERVRLELLAGLIDTDGNYDSRGDYEITQKSENMARQIKFIADSLGFRTRLRSRSASIDGRYIGDYWRLNISGDIERIPCKVERKKANAHYSHRSWLVSNLTIDEKGVGEWCGIMVDGNHRYLHADGTVTHNSGKSFGASTFINDLTFEYSKRYKKPHNILFTRYTMVSAGISIIPEVVDKINTDGLGDFFRQTKTDIVNRMTGARIMFRGIHTSSGNQTAKLKSIAGVTTFVVDEAEEWVSYDEFEKIFLSMRQKGLQIRAIIIMNPSDSNHWVYEKYIKDTHKIVEFDGVPVQISTHPDVLHIHTTYLDNRQYLSDTFIHQVEQMKESDPERYAHIVMGRWSDVAEGAVFKKWGIVEEFPEYARKIARAVDFGYTNDVTCIVRCGVVDNRLYIDELCYKTYMTSGDLIREFKAEEERGEDGFIYSESADPRLVDEIAMGGVIIKPVAKGGGSIEAGLSKMLSMEVFVTKRSVHAQEEFRNYVYDKDKDGHYLNVPVDKWNHCFVGESQILTKDGNKRLDDVCVGDYVATSKGYKKVEKVFNNGYKKILHTVLNFGNFMVEVKGTPDHKVKTNLGWIELQNLKPGMILFLGQSNSMEQYTVEHKVEHIERHTTNGLHTSQEMCGSISMVQYPRGVFAFLRMAIHSISPRIIFSVSPLLKCNHGEEQIGMIWNRLSSMANFTQGIQENGISQEETTGCIGMSGSSIMVLSLKDATSTTKMKIQPIIPLTTLNFLKGQATSKDMRKSTKERMDILREPARIWHWLVKRLKSGTIPNKEESGTGAIIKQKYSISRSNSSVITVVSPSSEKDMEITVSAPIIARVGGDITRDLTMKQESAPSVDKNSCAISILSNDFVQNGAVEFIPTTLMGVEVLDSSIEQVYDLQVEDVHEYSVNGVLVHNCIDAARYYVLGNIMGKLIKPKAVSKADLGLV